MAKLPWTPWHKVVNLRDDLKSGDLPLHMFAADLYEVMMQTGIRPIYEKPEEFFALTFPTHNLRNLVREVALRLAGKNDKAIRQLELTYGGGKTHTLITMWHLVHDPDNLPDLPAVREFTETIGQCCPRPAWRRCASTSWTWRPAATCAHPKARCGGSNSRGACWPIRWRGTRDSSCCTPRERPKSGTRPPRRTR